jgi:hypothetical protein
MFIAVKLIEMITSMNVVSCRVRVINCAVIRGKIWAGLYHTGDRLSKLSQIFANNKCAISVPAVTPTLYTTVGDGRSCTGDRRNSRESRGSAAIFPWECPHFEETVPPVTSPGSSVATMRFGLHSGRWLDRSCEQKHRLQPSQQGQRRCFHSNVAVFYASRSVKRSLS